MIRREPAMRAVRLQTLEIPATRLAGFAVVGVLLPLYNAAVAGNPRWSSLGTFALTASLYCLGSWLILRSLFTRCHRIPLADLFLMADVMLLLYAVQLTGGPESWLFLLLAGRCIDQLSGGFRRAVWFNHMVTGSYALYLLVASLHRFGVPWTAYAVKLALLYSFNWYASLTARTVDSIRGRARRAEAAKRSTMEMAGAVAHAIRTSTDGIAVLAELLAQTPLDVRQRNYVSGLMEHSRNVLEKLPVLHAPPADLDAAGREEPFSPRAIVEEVAALLRPLAESKGLDLRVELGSETPLSARGDIARVRQVLLAVAHNAIRFTEVGFVELSCRRHWPGQIALQVRDSGPGIPAGTCKRVLKRFIRADGSPWQRSHGNQIGLPLCRRLVESMGGRLALESQPGLGATVRIELPLLGSSFFDANASPAPEVLRPK